MQHWEVWHAILKQGEQLQLGESREEQKDLRVKKKGRKKKITSTLL